MDSHIIESPRTAPPNSARKPSPLDCSIIIPVLQECPKFEECLASVRAAARETDEIIVVVDGTGEGSCKDAERVGMRVIRLPETSGPARARNVGAEAARSEILFFVDADVVINPDAVERVRAAFRDEPGVAAFIGSYDEQPNEQNFHSQYKNLFHHFVHQHGLPEASTFWGACGAIRREIFHKIGGFNEDYERPSVEDIELGYRLKETSHRIRLLPDLQVKHLKRWEAGSLIKTDMLDRAAPWTALLWDQFLRRKPRLTKDLNLGRSYQLSLLSSFLLIVAAIATLFTKLAWPLMLLSGGFFVLANIPFFKFFSSKRGRGFALHALGWRFGYDIYSGLGFFYGSMQFASATTRKILTSVYARIDPVAMGTAVGAFLGGAVFAATVILLIKGGTRIGPNLSLLGQFFAGYEVTWRGSLIGLLYGFTAGFLFGFLFAVFRNAAMRLHLGSLRVQRFLYRLRETEPAS